MTDDLRAQLAERDAIIARMRKTIEVWKGDARLRVAADVILREFDRIAAEERERTARGER